jgi:hypothetical protein
MPPSPEEMELFLIDRAGQLNKILVFVQNIYKIFIQARVANTWASKTVPSISKWIRSS